MSDDEIVEADYDVQADGSGAMRLLNQAVENGAGTDTMEKLIELQERWEENEARKAFDAAMADLRSDLPTISKNNTVSHSGASYDYEDLSTIVEKVSPAMAEHNLSFRWRTDSEEANNVKVTCIISHRDGHSEETTLSASPDTSGSKNPIQAIGSTVTYLQRYTLKAALGIAAGPDDDAQAVGNDKSGNKKRKSKKKAQGGKSTTNNATPQDYVNKLLKKADDMDVDAMMDYAENTVDDYDDKTEGWRQVYAYLKDVINGDEELEITDDEKLGVIPF
jgi:hypothetical protein